MHCPVACCSSPESILDKLNDAGLGAALIGPMMQLFCVLCFGPTSGRQYLVACFGVTTPDVKFSVELQCDLGLELSNSKFLASVLWVHSEGQTHCGVVNGSNRSSHAVKLRGQTSSSEDLDDFDCILWCQSHCRHFSVLLCTLLLITGSLASLPPKWDSLILALLIRACHYSSLKPKVLS